MIRITMNFRVDIEKPNGSDVGSVMNRIHLTARACNEAAQSHIGALTREQAPMVEIGSSIAVQDVP